MKIPYYIIISFCFLSSTLTAQTYLFEDFNLGIPANWDIEYIGESTTNWTHNDGGALIGAYKFPPNAKEGNYNAFFRKEGNKGQKTRLITPLMDFTGGEKPMLKFWHAQAEWGVGTGDHENLRIFIKSANYDDWIQWEEYIDPVPSWTERNLFVPDSLISDSVYFAFEGETNFGAGLCIDSLVVYETGIIPYQLQESEYYQANTRFLTAGSDNNPLIYVNLKTYGNVGSLEMNRIAFDASSINSANIKINGAHLFHTTRPYFNTDTVIATDDLSGDSIVFNNLEYTLDFGDNYFWLALDIADDAIYGQSIDASFKSSGIDVSLDTTGLSDYSSVWISNDTVYYVIESDTLNGFINFDLPHSDISPDGDRKIKNTVFFDDFETDTNWTLNGDFEIAPPQGRGASDALGSPDPESAYDGDNILGTDLTGQGAKDGDYENNAAMYYAQLDFQDGFYFNDLYLSYNLWINKQSVDEGYIELSVDSGATWEKVRNYANYNRDYWEYDTVYLGNYNADQQKNIGVRFVMGPTSSVQAYSGWNVDNFAIAGNFIDKDVGITQIVEPYDECGHTTNDSIKVWLRNYAGIPVVDTTPIPIYYSLDDGDTKFYDTVYVNLGLVDSTLVTLNITANLIQPDIYNLMVATDLEGDEGPDNDDYSKAIYSFPTYTPGYTENFESNEGVFKNYGRNDKWQYGSFTGQMSPPPTGVKGWATGHGSNYNANDSSYLETGCYDFTGGGRHLVAFSFWMQTVTGEDGLNLQFSLD
ncbi:MAG: hypothetical protein GVY19_13985, partial [Bacteroidetes bacterium]|nr:hypothetical protein [Bacteroidota bacterium]